MAVAGTASVRLEWIAVFCLSKVRVLGKPALSEDTQGFVAFLYLTNILSHSEFTAGLSYIPNRLLVHH